MREEFLRFLGPEITMFPQITEAHAVEIAEPLRRKQVSVSASGRETVPHALRKFPQKPLFANPAEKNRQTPQDRRKTRNREKI